MKIVYLDQNKWIDLARSFHGRDADPDLAESLAYLLSARQSNSAAFPLSAVHYMELYRIRSIPRRHRLGQLMWRLSEGATFASNRRILDHELELALSTRFPLVVVRPFTLLGLGVAFAFDQPVRVPPLPPSVLARVSPEQARELRAQLAFMIERAIVTGEGPRLGQPPTFTNRIQGANFLRYLASLPERAAQLPRRQHDDMLYALSMVDILEPLNGVFARHGLAPSQLLDLGRDEVKRFMDDLPSRRIDIHLSRHVLRNPALRSKLTDLEDWAALIPAAAHCDVLVCERHFASMITRDGFSVRATVLTDVRDLPAALA